MATREEIEEIRTRVDILSVISRYVSVRPRGKNFLAICPFHPDKSPSLTISPEKGLFHCFGCGEGGDVFRFFLKIERIEFPEAVRRLAAQAGVALPSERRAMGGLEPLRELAERAARHYERRLKEPVGQQARHYLQGRGIAPETIARFRLGFAPSAGDDVLRAFQGSEEALVRLGLAMEGERGRWSFFRDRVIFPLLSSQGDVVGFAGRTLGEEEPKYLNTKNTPLFEKSRLLYGFSHARAAFTARGEALLVEGYLDVLMSHQQGFTHAVGSMGTAFTAEQAQLLKRFVPRVLIAYDRDVAGRAATLRGMKQLLRAGLEVSIVLLPTGEDPDELLRQEGREAFQTLLQQAVPFPEFYVQALLEEHAGKSLRGQEEILAAVRTFLADLESPALRTQILKEVSGGLDIPLEDLRLGVKGRESSVIMGSSTPDKQSWGVEEHLMYLMLQGEYPIERAVRELTPKDFPKFWRAVEVLFALYREEAREPDRLAGVHRQPFLNEWLSRLDPEEQKELRELAVSERRDADSERAIAQLIGQLRLTGAERRLTALEREIRAAERQGDPAATQRLQHEQQALFSERRRLLRQLGWGASVARGGGRRHGG
jgi:DNA primase